MPIRGQRSADEQPFTREELQAVFELEVPKAEAERRALELMPVRTGGSARVHESDVNDGETPAFAVGVFVLDVTFYALLAEMSTDLATRVERWVRVGREGPHPELSDEWEDAFIRERAWAREYLRKRGKD